MTLAIKPPSIPFHDAVSKISEGFRTLGFQRTIVKIAAHLIRPLYYSQESVFMTRPFDRSFAPPKNPCPEFELREGTIKELIASDWPGKNRIGGFTYNTKAGARCCIGRINGKIISFTFMTTLQFRDPVTAILIRPEPGQVYQFEGEIRPGDRGRAYGYHHSIHYAAKMLREGFREAICLVEPSNMNSWKLHLSMGFEPKRICRHCHFLSRFAIIRWSAYTGSGNKFTQRKSP